MRKEINLDSIFLRDYENSLGIDPEEVSQFFEGYVEDLSELDAEETEENLWGYYCSIEW